ncbi:MAG: hypothetical protein ACLGG7_04405 [Bacteriovoracia bacterium]
MDSLDFSVERKHIHELANHLTIIQGAVRKVLRNLDEKKLGLPEEKERLLKADDYLKKSIESLRELRTQIIDKINTQENLD